MVKNDIMYVKILIIVLLISKVPIRTFNIDMREVAWLFLDCLHAGIVWWRQITMAHLTMHFEMGTVPALPSH